MKNAFNKEVVRSITQSAGRFIAILIISLLGAGFYAGLRMAAPDMRIAGDQFFDGARFYDISVMTSLGLDDDSLSLLADVEGVGAVMPAYRADVLVDLGAGSYAATVESIPIAAARQSDTSDGVNAVSADDGYLNRPILLEGSWPARVDECVVGADAAAGLGIGLGDVLNLSSGTADLDDTFSVTEFTVCGLVNSASYASSSMLGTTSLGTGSVELYLYVREDAFAQDMPYTVAYLSVPAALSAVWGSERYDDDVQAVKDRVEALVGQLATGRHATVVGDAQGELDDARADYEKERADAEKELADAKSELDDAYSQLNDAQSELGSGHDEMAAAAEKLQESEKQLDKGEEEYAAGVAQLAEQKAAAQAQMADAQEQLNAQRGQLDAQLATLRGQRQQLVDGIGQIQAGIDAIDQQLAAIDPESAGAPEAIEQLTAQKEGLSAQLVEFSAQLEQADGGIAALQDGLTQLDAGQAQLDAQRTAAADQFAKAQAKLDAARDKLDRGRAELEAGKKHYQQGLKEYERGVAEYEDGKAEYESGVAEYQDGVKDAQEGFADAESELADAQAEIDDIERPDVFVLDRSKNPGVASLKSDADGITQIALFLPFMFFLVAALVSLTSMTRMVDEERMVIGTHKALGYGKAQITAKYLVYGVLASAVGSVVGVMTLGKLLPWFIMTSYGVSYAVPVFPTPIDPWIATKAIGLSVGVTVVATWGAAAASLREKPAALMLPRAPKAGKRIFLERIRPMWSRMSFSHKVIARNLLRYKRRFFMAVIGIAGCTALLVVGFGLRDAIGGIVASQYVDLRTYDAEVRIDDDAPPAARDAAVEALVGEDVVSQLPVDGFNLLAAGNGKADDLRIQVVVPQDEARLAQFVTLRDRKTQQPLQLSRGMIVLTEKAAEVLGVATGDQVMLYDENDVGDRMGEGRAFTVGGIAENYLGHYAYLLPGDYEASFGEAPSFDLCYVQLADDADRSAFANRLQDTGGVSTVSFVADQVATYEDMLGVMNKLIFVIMGLSAALAFVVLYNLTNINIAERVREIATIKVLGFTRAEVNAYIFREVLVMSLIGALVGCVLGVPLTFYIARAAETANMMFGRSIDPMSFVLSFAITLIFTGIVLFTMRHKLARVNMVESLKSVE